MASTANKSTSKKDLLKPSKDTNSSKLTSKEIREEYFNQLRSWLNTVNSYQCYYNKLQRESFQNNYQQILKNPNEVPKVVPNVVGETPTVELNQFVGIRCQIPSLWKRFGAEFIDFLLLSFIKFLIAYFIVDSILEIDFAKYNSIFTRDDYNVDYTTAVEMTSELLVIEVTHRTIVCLYEIYCLQGRTFFQGGGATVGKILLDLTVVRADKLFNIRGQHTDVIALIPGGDIGWKRAGLRSISKNLFFSFLFPLPFITAAANQNRCAYDVLCGTIVVEAIQPLKCEQSELIPIA